MLSSILGRRADAICAAYFGAEAAMRLIRPGNTASRYINLIECISTDQV
jgi:hypothetical protein